jgi:DNA-binding CsgD family transcriptional regulator
MLMIILEQTKWKQHKWLVGLLTVVSICIFFIAASPGYSDIYYASASLATVNGASVLVKEYGPLHPVYLYYLISYFAAMIGVIVHATIHRKMTNQIHAVILAFAVFVNIGVWLFGQLVDVPFEFLSVSYIISGFFILALQLLQQQELQIQADIAAQAAIANAAETDYGIPTEKLDFFEASLADLTPTEHLIYEAYLEGKTSKEVMEEQHIKENTLKYHNKNIYSKLGVSSKKELMEVAKVLKLKK